MVEQFLRLKLTLLSNTLRRRPIHRAGVVLGVLYAAVLGVIVVVGIIGLRSGSADLARVVLSVFGSVVILAFLLLPLAFAADDPLDPRKFALFGIAPGRLARDIAVASVVSVPVALVALLALGQVVAWTRGPVPVLLAILGAVLIVVTAVLASRVSTGIASTFLSSRRSRDASSIALLAILAVLAPLVALLATADSQSQIVPVLRRIAVVVAWTPLGAVWSMPGDAATGDFGAAFARLGIAVGFALLLWLAWRLLVSVTLARPERSAVSRSYAGLGWFERLPATPSGVIAARSLSYWGRDARYRVALAVIPVIPVIMVGALMVGGISVEVIVWVPVPVMCLFLGWLAHNDLAHDSSAFWAHVSASTRGIHDRWGRLVPALLIGIPLALLGSLLTVLVTDHWQILPGLIGLSLCALFVSLGIASVTSARFPYPAVHPGDSPFAQPQAVTSGAPTQALALLFGILLSAPVLVVILLEPGLDGVQWLALALGLVIGVAVLAIGVTAGGRVIDNRAPELLAFTLRN